MSDEKKKLDPGELEKDVVFDDGIENSAPVEESSQPSDKTPVPEQKVTGQPA